jgi:hypothetical protein
MNRFLLLLVLGITAAGCSSRAVYDNIQINQRNDCAKEPPSDYFECLERADKSFDEYQREREELLEGAEPESK